MAPNLSLRGNGLDFQHATSMNAFTLQKRQADRWSIEEQYALGQVADDSGQFNGTCTSLSQTGLPPRTDPGECASYYDDVTLYCCAAVGGMIVNLIQPSQSDPNADGISENNSTASSSSSSASSTSTSSSSNQVIEPSCQTTNYNDMLLCYKYTAEDHCRSAESGPWGVCNVSKSTSSSSSSTSDEAAKLSSTAVSSARGNNRNQRKMTKERLAVVAVILFVTWSSM